MVMVNEVNPMRVMWFIREIVRNGELVARKGRLFWFRYRDGVAWAIKRNKYLILGMNLIVSEVGNGRKKPKTVVIRYISRDRELMEKIGFFSCGWDSECVKGNDEVYGGSNEG
jgi:hypothetical protein